MCEWPGRERPHSGSFSPGRLRGCGHPGPREAADGRGGGTGHLQNKRSDAGRCVCARAGGRTVWTLARSSSAQETQGDPTVRQRLCWTGDLVAHQGHSGHRTGRPPEDMQVPPAEPVRGEGGRAAGVSCSALVFTDGTAGGPGGRRPPAPPGGRQAQRAPQRQGTARAFGAQAQVRMVWSWWGWRPRGPEGPAPMQGVSQLSPRSHKADNSGRARACVPMGAVPDLRDRRGR